MKIKTLLIALCSFLLSATLSVAATSITKNLITWNFDGDYTVGQFVTGDYWVLDTGNGVTINSVTPTPTITTNGTMINPVVGGTHCLDSRAEYYSAASCASFPLNVHAKDSVLSSVSVGQEGITTDWNGGSIDSHTFVASAEILTVVNYVPGAGEFRPAYVDRAQTRYSTQSMDNSKLPKLVTPAALPHPVSYYERGMARPWLQFVFNWNGRGIHAVQNMYEYHRELSSFLSEFCLIMMSDTPGIETATNEFVQLGIDNYHIGRQGDGDSSFWVPPVLFTGILLNDTEMKNLFTNGLLKSVPRDYPDFYYWADHQSTISSSIVPVGQTWTGATVFFRNQIGNGEHEHLHPSEWDVPTVLDHWKNDAYRRGIDSWTQVGMVLAARLLGNNAQQLWGHPATFDYIDRWMNEDWNAECIVLNQYDPTITCPMDIARGGSNFIDAMWDTYRGYVPPSLGGKYIRRKVDGKFLRADQ